MSKRMTIAPDPGLDNLVLDFYHEIERPLKRWLKENPQCHPQPIRDPDLSPDPDLNMYAITTSIALWAAEAPFWGELTLEFQREVIRQVGADYFFAVAHITREWLRDMPTVKRWLMTKPRASLHILQRSDKELVRLIERDEGKKVSPGDVRFWRTEIAKRQKQREP